MRTIGSQQPIQSGLALRSRRVTDLLFYCLGHIRRRGVVGRVSAFHSDSPGSIPGRIKNFNSYRVSGTDYAQSREDN